MWNTPDEPLSYLSRRQADEMLIFGKIERTPSEIEALLDEMMIEGLRHIPMLEPLRLEENKVVANLWELMSLKPAQQRKAIRREPYRSLSLAETLIQHSAEFLQGKIRPRVKKNPKEGEKFAILAERIANQPWPEERERAILVRAEACRFQSKARRLLRDWKGAELSLAAAYAALKELEPTLEHIFFLRELSKLREDQGRLHEAVDLIRLSFRLYAKLWSTERLPGDEIVELAYLYLKQNDPWCAFCLFTQLADDMDHYYFVPEADVALGLAICLAAFGLAEPARLLLKESQPSRRDIADRDNVLRLEWLACRVAVHIGDLEDAIPQLEAIRRWLLEEHDDLADICSCSIDLAYAHAKKGDAAAWFPDLLLKIAKLPKAADEPWALGSLWWLREALEKRRDPAWAAREAAAIVHRREKSLARLVKGKGASRGPAAHRQ